MIILIDQNKSSIVQLLLNLKLFGKGKFIVSSFIIYILIQGSWLPLRHGTENVMDSMTLICRILIKLQISLLAVVISSEIRTMWVFSYLVLLQNEWKKIKKK